MQTTLATSLEALASSLEEAPSLQEKLALLDSALPSPLPYAPQNEEEELILKELVAIGQLERLIESAEDIPSIVQELLPVERFYSSIGGLIGYHYRMLALLGSPPSPLAILKHHPPEGIDISYETEEVKAATLEGVKRLGEIGVIFPLGGAADRLQLHDDESGEPLPAACLRFLGKTLLEGLIDDLTAQENLHFLHTGKSLITPIAIMTSREKNNHDHVVRICEEASWFGRPKESFRFFCQPLVPTLTKSGEWCLQSSGKLLLKPGGHGVLWRLAIEEGIFEWFFSLGRKKVVVRQINNPVAATDYGLLAFIGLGLTHNKTFGFASCPRQVKASEGINVLIEAAPSEYLLTNVEYCDFKKVGIADKPSAPGSPFSRFPSNTNILFADLEAISQAVAKCPLPGVLVNLKKLSHQGKEEEIARLESTMQNIADYFPPAPKSELKTFLTYNERRKTISTVKRSFSLGASLLETPEGCLLDILTNNHALLKQCRIAAPEVPDPATFFASGPSFIFLYHPALGPLYSLIAKKLRGGHLAKGSELQLDIADADIEGLALEGSLLIKATQTTSPTGRHGKCILRNVRVENKGIDFEAPNTYWKNEIQREERLEITLHGHSEFVAENLTFTGNFTIEVPDGVRLEARLTEGKITFHATKLKQNI